MSGLLMVLGVGAGTALGAAGRYGADVLQARLRSRRGPDRAVVPWATCTVNVVGSALLGAAWGLASRGVLGPGLLVVVGAGLAGGLTTYSTFAVEVVHLLRARRPVVAAGYAVGSVVLGVAAAVAGHGLVPGG